MKLKICHLYGDLLNLYGDRGNIISIKKRLEWRGIDCAVEKLNPGQRAVLSGYDLIFIGGGMEFDTRLIADDLRSGTASELKAAVEDGVGVLSICSGYQLLGQYCQDAKGVKTSMAGVVDMYSVCGKERMTGNYKFTLGEKSGGFEVDLKGGSGSGIMQMLGGTLLFRMPEDGTLATLALPLRSGGMVLESNKPKFDLSGGFNTVVLELSDVLPLETFFPEAID